MTGRINEVYRVFDRPRVDQIKPTSWRTQFQFVDKFYEVIQRSGLDASQTTRQVFWWIYIASNLLNISRNSCLLLQRQLLYIFNSVKMTTHQRISSRMLLYYCLRISDSAASNSSQTNPSSLVLHAQQASISLANLLWNSLQSLQCGYCTLLLNELITFWFLLAIR